MFFGSRAIGQLLLPHLLACGVVRAVPDDVLVLLTALQIGKSVFGARGLDGMRVDAEVRHDSDKMKQ